MSTNPDPETSMKIDSAKVNEGEFVWRTSVQIASAEEIEKVVNSERATVRYLKYSEIMEKDLKLPKEIGDVRPASNSFYSAEKENSPTIGLEKMKEKWAKWYPNAEMKRELAASGLKERNQKVTKIFAFNLEAMSVDADGSFDRHQMVKDTVNYLWLENDKRAQDNKYNGDKSDKFEVVFHDWTYSEDDRTLIKENFQERKDRPVTVTFERGTWSNIRSDACIVMSWPTKNPNRQLLADQFISSADRDERSHWPAAFVCAPGNFNAASRSGDCRDEWSTRVSTMLEKYTQWYDITLPDSEFGTAFIMVWE